ncbi:MAG: hypothetical protein M5R40_07130 [Anaerolineae bacterium]|nr:hypothetical protein [Anaerolineae bacterium]
MGLQLNTEKTEIYDVKGFLEATSDDELLDRLSDQYEDLVNPLWIMDEDYRREFRRCDRSAQDVWWDVLDRYRNCLREIGIHITLPELSRRIHRYLYNHTRRAKDLKGREEMALPFLSATSTVSANRLWADDFRKVNSDWVDCYNDFRTQLIALFEAAVERLRQDDISPAEERQLVRYLRFTVSKLAEFGFEEVKEGILETLRDNPWRIREPLHVLEKLARQGFAAEILQLLRHHISNPRPTDSEYMRAASLRALRFLPRNTELDWNMIVDFATDPKKSVIERLMATETWLYCDPPQPPINRQHLEAVMAALRADPPLPSRLRKNYLLILGRYDQSAVSSLSIAAGTEYMLLKTTELVTTGQTVMLFDYEEPAVLRRKYYSGQNQEVDRAYSL